MERDFWPAALFGKCTVGHCARSRTSEANQTADSALEPEYQILKIDVALAAVTSVAEKELVFSVLLSY